MYSALWQILYDLIVSCKNARKQNGREEVCYNRCNAYLIRKKKRLNKRKC